jgi:glutamine synthetase
MANEPQDAAALLARLERDGIEHLWVVYHDFSGRGSAKTIPKSGFRSAVHEGVVFALANLNMDALDHQAETATLLADSGDFLAVPDPRSYVQLPRFPNTAKVHAWMRATDGMPWQGCPRTRLQGMVDELEREGFSAYVALEPEFYLLHRTDDGNYAPVNRARMFSEEGLAIEDTFIREVLGDLAAMGITVPQFGKEYALGQYELSIRHTSPVEAVDHYYLLKSTVRDAARDRGYIATFMPKPYAAWTGNSMHAHVSVWDAAGERDLTASSEDTTSLSDIGRWFMGGLLHHIDALTGLGSPTVNSYKRLLPGSWAPANTYWGYGNRSGVIRVPGVGDRRHIELRSGDNSAQPALFVTGMLAAGMDGILGQMDPGPAFDRDIGHMTQDEIIEAGIGYLPRTLPEALAALEADEVIAGAVGPEALKHFLAVKRSELDQYNLDVHPWERHAYLEVS